MIIGLGEAESLAYDVTSLFDKIPITIPEARIGSDAFKSTHT